MPTVAYTKHTYRCEDLALLNEVEDLPRTEAKVWLRFAPGFSNESGRGWRLWVFLLDDLVVIIQALVVR